MQTADKKGFTFGFKGIEIVQSSINPLQKPETKIENFVFNIEVNQKIDASNKLVFVFVRIMVLLPDVKDEAGSLTVLCVFNVENFDEVLKKEEDKIEAPDQLINTLNSIAISTARGTMYALFKGTFLHKAILPIIDPTQLKPQPLPIPSPGQ